LFDAYNPNELENFVDGINKNSMILHSNSLMHK